MEKLEDEDVGPVLRDVARGGSKRRGLSGRELVTWMIDGYFAVDRPAGAEVAQQMVEVRLSCAV